MRTILLAGVALAAAGAAVAQVPSAPQARDGIQTRAEVVQRVRAMFARADVNRDGFLTQAEVQSVAGQARGLRGQRAADPARRQRAFERLDANRDNVISRDEWARAQQVRAERQAERGAHRGQRLAMRGRMGGALLRMADTNRDQRVSLQEAEGAALQRFDRVDLNRDGRVTRDERQQLRQQWQSRRGQARG